MASHFPFPWRVSWTSASPPLALYLCPTLCPYITHSLASSTPPRPVLCLYISLFLRQGYHRRDSTTCVRRERDKIHWQKGEDGVGLTERRIEIERTRRVKGLEKGVERNREHHACSQRLQHREGLVQRRRHAVYGATILIRRWIYGLNHRRIIWDSRALLPPTETYACLFADNCTWLLSCFLYSLSHSP